MRDGLQHPLAHCLRHCLTVMPSLRKQTNQYSQGILKAEYHPLEAFPLPSACIIDGMRLLNKTKDDSRTFGYIAESTCMYANQSGTDSGSIDIVFDVYKKSVKTAEREGRGEASCLIHCNIVACQKIQQ